MNVDLHIHTKYSGHSLLKIEDIAKTAKKRGLDAVAITDHDEVKGGLELSKTFPTIIAEEISCNEGDLIGLFLTERIEKGPVLEAMDKIRAQGGLVMIPHPFDTMRREALMKEELCSKGDVIEVFNSRVMKSEDNIRAAAFSKQMGIPAVVGSDAHTLLEIGRSWMEIASCESPKAFMDSLKDAKVHASRSPFIVHAQTKLLKLREAFR